MRESNQLRTCRDCEHLDGQEIGGCRVFGCGKTGFIVPHSSDGETRKAVFWRIPMSCPRPDVEVQKQEQRQPERHWQSLVWSDGQ